LADLMNFPIRQAITRAMGDQAITRERIRQIGSNTMSKLRHLSRSQVPRGYLD
jgi:DNA-directed RNA polymerase sigma subunit (sigma70/sigma32)